jgi:hypothetical protein
MTQVIQLKRKVTGPGVPTTLAPGELAYNSSGHELFVGDGSQTVQNLVSANRQVEIAGQQTILGAKTIDVTLLKIPGGAASYVLQTDGAGNLAWVSAPPPTPATDAEMDAGTRNDVFGTPKNTRALVGASVQTLATAAKTIVPAINEVKAAVDLVAIGSQFVGSFDATAGEITWTTASGATGNALPTASAANNGWYLIADVAGSLPPIGAAAGAYEIGDWLISNGTAWTHLQFGGVSAVTATQVTVNPAVAGATNVQAALTQLDADIDAAAATDATKVAKAGDTMTGALYLPVAAPLQPTEAAHKQYVDDTLNAAIGGGTTVVVSGPELVGNGLGSSPITLVAVDGGVYA